MTLPTGTRLGPTEILSPIGAGGMWETDRLKRVGAPPRRAPKSLLRATRLGLVITLFTAGFPTAVNAATVWNLELSRGRTARTTVTILNRCGAKHAFEVTVDPKTTWLSFPAATNVSVPSGAGVAAEAVVDTRTLDPGERNAQVTVHCLDCVSEPGCTQDRDLFLARLKVLWSEQDLRSLDQAEVFPGEVLALIETGADRGSLRQFEKSLSLTIEGSFALPTIDRTMILFRMAAPEKGLAAVLGALQKDPSVRLAQPNFVYQLARRPASASDHDRQYALDLIGATRIRTRTTGRGVTVAVLDSWVNPKHPGLAGAISESIEFFRGPVPVITEGHGTAMAGIIGARNSSGEGIGVAPDATLLTARVCGSPSAHAHEVCSSDAIARGLDFAVARKARVVSMSLAGSYDPLVSRLAYRAVELGIVLVAAVGNDGPSEAVRYPAALEPVIAVTAIDRENHLYARANRGPRVDLAAPGVDVLTLAAPESYGSTTGTSPATAEVSGAIALLLQIKPELSPGEVRTLLEETAHDLGPPGRDDQFGNGGLDVCAAVARLLGDATLCR